MVKWRSSLDNGAVYVGPDQQGTGDCLMRRAPHLSIRIVNTKLSDTSCALASTPTLTHDCKCTRCRPAAGSKHESSDSWAETRLLAQPGATSNSLPLCRHTHQLILRLHPRRSHFRRRSKSAIRPVTIRDCMRSRQS